VPLIDITGNKYGRLTVIERAPNKKKKPMWNCLCECGNKITARSDQLKCGDTKSCGCFRKEVYEQGNNRRSHGKTNHRLYRIYRGMRNRCKLENHVAYKHYGGRGIKVCDEWLCDFKKFYDWSINNGYSDNLSIDRIDSNGNYKPTNCQWVTQKVQARNTRQNVNIKIDGEVRCLTDWCDIYNIRRTTAQGRLDSGWGVKESFSVPAGGKR